MGIITDPIGDMLTRIKQANQRKHRNLVMPHSNIKFNICRILKKEGYILDYQITINNKDKQPWKKGIVLWLKYKSNVSAITDLKRISKPGLRVYVTVENLPRVLSGFGIAIISTSKGLLTDKEARQQKIGGELLANVW